MKKLSALLLTVSLSLMSTFAQNNIMLPAPQKAGGLSTAEAFANRSSQRQYDSSKQLDVQVISDMLWSALGVNRDNGLRTNPTAMNRQEISVYLFTDAMVYEYDHLTHSLIAKVEGDHRRMVAGAGERIQEFVLDAPCSVLIVADLNKTDERWGYTDAGIVSQNINIFCAANGLATVTRGSMDHEGLVSLLGLAEGVRPLLNNPVGYAR